MQDPVELVVHKQLSHGLSVESIGQNLFQLAMNNHSNPESLRAIGYFLYNTGQFPLLFTLIAQLADANKTIPWGALTLALLQLTDNIPPSYIDLILEGAEAQEELSQILPIGSLESVSKKIATERKKYWQHIQNEYANHKKSILDKITYFRSQRLILDEEKALEELKIYFPAAEELPSLLENFQYRKSEYLISQMEHAAHTRRPTQHQRVPPPPVEIQPWISKLVKMCQQNAASSAQEGLDLSLMFYFFELYNEALSVLSWAPESESVNWLRLELKILAGRYVDAMEEARHLEKLYTANPESAFATTYARAVCLWELGQRSLAISLLQSIVRIRPYFRAAHSLLKQWTEENL